MDYLNSRLMFGMMPGLDSTEKLCEILGNPQKKFKTIHVVGTNGKGSTSYYLAGILQAHGFKTGLFTSPHLVNLRERIRIDDLPIAEELLDQYLLQVKEAADRLNRNLEACGGTKPIEPTFFEVLTLVAFLHYANAGVEVAVLEAGMGGRLDSTAVACGDVVVLTSIGLEHTEILGDTEEKILKEKLAVVEASPKETRCQKTLVLGGIQNKLIENAKAYAKACSASCIFPEIRNDVVLPNLGHHYVENASLSLAAAKCFCERNRSYNDTLAVSCLANRSWTGRMQLLRNCEGKTEYILDGAHNSHAVKRLVESLDKYYPGQKFHCVFGALKDKDVGDMLKLMSPHVSQWHITKTPYPRFRELDDLRNLLTSLGLNVASEGELNRHYLDQVRIAAESAPNEKLPVLVTGSLYMIGETVQCLKNDYAELAFFRSLEPTTNEHR